MYQRSSSYIMSTKNGWKVLFEGALSTTYISSNETWTETAQVSTPRAAPLVTLQTDLMRRFPTS